jgi:acetoin utilization deacetylase AcuC-like enzyme
VAASVALRDYPALIRRVLVVDLDVHQGNGCAVLFQDEPRVTTFSLHCAGNFFSEKQRSDLDVEVPPGAGDDEYLALLREHLPPLFERVQPDLTFFQAGVDPHEDDALGKLRLTSAGLKRRNKLVYEQAAAHATRLVVTMGGGYPKNPERLDLDGWVASRPFLSVVQCHMDVYRAAAAANARPW